MPCYTVRLLTVEFKAKHENLLEEAARLLKWTYSKGANYAQVGPVTVFFSRDQAQARRQDDINALKRAYSAAAVKAAGKAKGWTMSPWTTKAGNKTTTATKY